MFPILSTAVRLIYSFTDGKTFSRNELQLNLSTTATLGTEESGRCGEVLTRRNEEGSQLSLCYCRQFMLTAAYKWNTIKIRISLKMDTET